MKKFRMMLPMLAFVFAIAGAVAGDFLPPIVAYFKPTPTTCSDPRVTEQQNCQLSDSAAYPLCTILDGTIHRQAFKNANCTGVLRDIPQE